MVEQDYIPPIYYVFYLIKQKSIVFSTKSLSFPSRIFVNYAVWKLKLPVKASSPHTHILFWIQLQQQPNIPPCANLQEQLLQTHPVWASHRSWWIINWSAPISCLSQSWPFFTTQITDFLPHSFCYFTCEDGNEQMGQRVRKTSSQNILPPAQSLL